MKDKVQSTTVVNGEQKKKQKNNESISIENADPESEFPKEKKSKKTLKKVGEVMNGKEATNILADLDENLVMQKKKSKKRQASEDEMEQEETIEKSVNKNSKKEKKSKKASDKELVEESEIEVKANINASVESDKAVGQKKTKKTNSEENVSLLEAEAETSNSIIKKKKKTELLNGCSSDTDNKTATDKNAKTTRTDDDQKETEPPAKKRKVSKNVVDTVAVGENNEDKVVEPGSFSNFRISPATVEKLKVKGINALFPVQINSFDTIFDNFDTIVQARTGSGKTLSFALPLIEKLLEKKISSAPRRPPQVLVMAPTRELAKQVADTFTEIATRMTVVCVYGGTPIGPQERSIRNGIDILVGTPGRIQDLITRGALDLSQLSHVVLDEVDRMLDMGFADDVDQILQQRYTEGECDTNPQTLLFSATLPHWVHQTAKKYLRPDRKQIDLVGDDVMKTSKTVQHLAIQCSYFDRASTIGAVLQMYSGSQGRAMVFCETKRDADELALSQDIKQETQVIHGDVPQEKREMVLKGFRDGRHRCLIATDVAARGLDIPEVDLVIQCCPPKDVESYIHRSGRTGRAGREGTCVLFYKPREEYEVYNVERRAGIKFKKIGAPNPYDIIKASAEDAGRALVSIPAKTLTHFKVMAEKLMEEHKAVDLLSAALAVISGNAELKERSLLSSREGFTAYLYRTNTEMRQHGYVWRALERCLTPELKDKISRMRFCADQKGCVFDIPSSEEEELEKQWQDGKFDSLTKATELPELVTQEFSSDRRNSYGNGTYNNRWQQNGSFNGRGGNNRNFGGNRYNRSASSHRN